MSFNIDLYNKCQQCKNLQESFYMELENGEKLYNYWCDFNSSIGEKNCSKFKEKDKIVFI